MIDRYRDLLVSVDSSAASAARMRFAAVLAAKHEAHLAGLYLVPPPEAPRYRDSPLLIEIHREAVVRAREAEVKARRAFDDVVQTYGISAEWRTATGFADEELPLHTRYADLAIVGQIDADAVSNMAVPLVRPEDAALASGRPVLIVPYAGRFDSLDGHVLVAWNASREAARAVADAMPLLKAAQTITVIVVNPQLGVSGHGEEPGADIARHLARHGVRADVQQETAEEISVGDVLLSRAADFDTDLIVMGAYGHSRLRELLLGGATRTLLEHMTVPVLMSH